MQKRNITLIAVGLVAVLFATTLLTRSTLLAETIVGRAQAAAVQPEVLELQEMAADDTFAEIDLKSGFLLDPYLLRVIGGGTVETSELSETCTGFVNVSPDAVLNWSGESEALHVLVYSDSDPLLVIETPDGEILCNDDATDEIVDPLITLENPSEGAYQIYVGSFQADEPAYGFLVVTELKLDEEELDEIDLAPLLDRREVPEASTEVVSIDTLQIDEGAIFGTQELEAGFGSVSTPAAGGGDLPVFALENVDVECTGFASLVPSLSFDWAGEAELTVFFEGEEDTSLVVVTPDGELVCNSNTSAENLNPSLVLESASAGQYDVYITSMEPDGVAFGELTVTEESGLAPEILAPASQ